MKELNAYRPVQTTINLLAQLEIMPNECGFLQRFFSPLLNSKMDREVEKFCFKINPVVSFEWSLNKDNILKFIISSGEYEESFEISISRRVIDLFWNWHDFTVGD